MRCRFGCTPAMQAASPGGNKMPSPRLVSEGGLAMIRLLIVAAATYAAYRFTKKVIDDVPDNFDPLPMPGDERRALRRQSAAMGVEPRR